MRTKRFNTQHKARVCACHTLQTGCSPQKSTSTGTNNYLAKLHNPLNSSSKLTLFLHLPSNRLQIAVVVSFAHQNFPLAAAAILESEKTMTRVDTPKSGIRAETGTE